jgi:hypothetical protein
MTLFCAFEDHLAALRHAQVDGLVEELIKLEPFLQEKEGQDLPSPSVIITEIVWENQWRNEDTDKW